VRLDQRHDTDDSSRIKRVVELRGTQEVPRMDHQVNETKPQVRSSGNVAGWTRNGLAGRRRGERLSLTTCRIDHGSDRIISELITSEHVPSLIAVNACQQQRGEAIPIYDVLNQLAHRDLRRRRPIP
jgi:hypothetical protein